QLNLISHFYQVFSIVTDFIIDLLLQDTDISMGTILERDTHGDCPDIQLLLFQHMYCFHNFIWIKHFYFSSLISLEIQLALYDPMLTISCAWSGKYPPAVI